MGGLFTSEDLTFIVLNTCGGRRANIKREGAEGEMVQVITRSHFKYELVAFKGKKGIVILAIRIMGETILLS